MELSARLLAPHRRAPITSHDPYQNLAASSGTREAPHRSCSCASDLVARRSSRSSRRRAHEPGGSSRSARGTAPAAARGRCGKHGQWGWGRQENDMRCGVPTADGGGVPVSKDSVNSCTQVTWHCPVPHAGLEPATSGCLKLTMAS